MQNDKKSMQDNDKVLADVESQLVELASAQDWGNTFIKIKVLAPQEFQEKLNKLSEEKKDWFDTAIQDCLRSIEDLFEDAEDPGIDFSVKELEDGMK
jgi:hypothetical protein